MTQDEWIRLLRRQKLRLGSRGAISRMFVPLVEVAEFSLSHGFKEVISRTRLRLSGRTTPPPPPHYKLPIDDGKTLSRLTIPPLGAGAVTSIVIPVLNKAALTHQCVKSILKATPAGSYEIIVVDNASDVAMQKMLARINGLRVIRNEENAGFVGACNQGARAARGEFVVYLNNDTLVLPGWLDALVRTFDRDPAIGAVGAKLVYPNGLLQEAGGIIWSDGNGWQYGHNEDPDAPAYAYVREVDYCSGACLMLRRSTVEVLGGFDTRYAPAYYEDTDMAFRLREHGYRVMYQPASRVIHFEGATAGTSTSSGFKAYQVVNRQKFLERHATALAAQFPHDPDLLRSARDRRRGARVLVMDHMLPHPDQDAGSVRMMALLHILVDLGYRVTFLPDNLARTEPYASELQQIGVEVLYGPLSEIAFVEEHRDEFDIAILCRAHFAAKYLPALLEAKRKPFIIFDTVDLHFLREQRLAELENDTALARAAERTRDIELGVMRATDMVWLTSTHEAELLGTDETLPPLGIVPMIHDVRTDVPAFGPRRNILFIGGFRHAPNEDAVIYFVEEILPIVRAELRGVQFLVVGSHVPPRIQKLAGPDVKILGFVQDVEPIFDACRITVAPLRYGAGVKGKVTQSLAWGVPAVTTPIAAEGLRLVDGEHVLIGSDAAAFARHVIRAYQDEALWTRLSARGRQHIESHQGYTGVKETVSRMLTTALRDRGEPESEKSSLRA